MKENFMKFIEEKWRILVIIIALIFIGMGAVQALTNFKFDPKTAHNIELVLMVIAGALFINGKKKERQASTEAEEKEKQDEEKKQDEEESEKDNI